MSFGVTPAGFILKTQSDILREINIFLRKPENFGSDADLSSFGPIGVFTGLMSQICADKWENLEAVYYSNQIDNAEGVNLERVTNTRGISRLPALPSAGQLKFTGVAGSTVPSGTICQNAQGIQFQTTDSGTIAIAETEVIIDARAIQTGLNGNVPAGDITIIVNPVAGISAVTNDDDFEGGASVETDPDLRIRYLNLIGASGQSAPVIQLAFQEIDDVISASVLENPLDYTVDDLTPHSIKAIIEGGSNFDIGEVFIKQKLTGIETIGSEVLNLTDENGIARVYRFARPVNVDIFVEMDITINTAQISLIDFTAEFTDGIKENIIKYIGGTFMAQVFRGLGIGKDIESFQLVATQSEIPFIIGDIIVRVGKLILPTGERVDILSDERGTTDETKIVLNIS